MVNLAMMMDTHDYYFDELFLGVLILDPGQRKRMNSACFKNIDLTYHGKKQKIASDILPQNKTVMIFVKRVI